MCMLHNIVINELLTELPILGIFFIEAKWQMTNVIMACWRNEPMNKLQKLEDALVEHPMAFSWKASPAPHEKLDYIQFKSRKWSFICFFLKCKRQPCIGATMYCALHIGKIYTWWSSTFTSTQIMLHFHCSLLILWWRPQICSGASGPNLL